MLDSHSMNKVLFNKKKRTQRNFVLFYFFFEYISIHIYDRAHLKLIVKFQLKNSIILKFKIKLMLRRD